MKTIILFSLTYLNATFTNILILCLISGAVERLLVRLEIPRASPSVVGNGSHGMLAGAIGKLPCVGRNVSDFAFCKEAKSRGAPKVVGLKTAYQNVTRSFAVLIRTNTCVNLYFIFSCCIVRAERSVVLSQYL